MRRDREGPRPRREGPDLLRRPHLRRRHPRPGRARRRLQRRAARHDPRRGPRRRLDTFDLRDCYGPDLSYDEKRRLAARTLGPTPEELRAEVREDESSLRMYLGITRFLVEDATGWEGSRSALQRDCRRRAYEVILRSRAWSELISERYPHHVRLSIHPQNRGAAKFGIRLLGAADAWTTPWHSAPLRRADGTWELMHRRDAEKLGREVHRDGRPSHFEETGGAAGAPAV
ncbi:L-tyrosine/L-tryptophan isonitrile synthase family protein [Streptomyces somaliensis]|uniref:L-tyrosine/L-tryptophan isonitrile synthase family protein n=1 Tax=Streptomyces somaliensis TaxID=78355 RepID=UPI0027E58236|nr:L-tyrosine/L-tryptophan isonitrile synthase family protein [Streptomyces somaliensis]